MFNLTRIEAKLLHHSVMFSSVLDIAAPVAEGPLVTNDRELWRGSMFVQDMCNLKCVALSVSGNNEYVRTVCTFHSHYAPTLLLFLKCFLFHCNQRQV